MHQIIILVGTSVTIHNIIFVYENYITTDFLTTREVIIISFELNTN